MTDPFAAALAALSLEEKLTLVAGADMWHTAAVPRLGIPALWMSDGPNGVRGTQFSGSATSACFPCGSALGATFDAELVGEIATALGLEARRMGVHVLLGPTINICRLPIAGRNFECFSEDPYLSALLASSYVTGVQSNGVAAVVKHFVGNDSERDRYSTSSELDERTLREVYLAPFAAAIVEAGAWAVMSGYNRVNGVYACEHEELLQGVLKGEWGFTGPVISDWYGTTSTVAAANGGLDIEMPGPARRFDAKLRAAVTDGEVDVERLDDMVRRVLGLVARTTGSTDTSSDDGTPPYRLIRSAAAAATVLLSNKDALLPLDAERITKIALVGPNAVQMLVHGGGSARVNAPYVVTPLEAIRARCGTEVEVTHEPGCLIERALPILGARHLRGPDGTACEQPVSIEYYDNPDLAGEPYAIETGPSLHFAWNGPPVPGLAVNKYSVRLVTHLVPAESGPAELGIGGIGRMRLKLEGDVVIENWDDPVLAPTLFGRGTGQLRATAELVGGVPVLVEVEFQAPEADLAQRALEMSPVPPTERENSAFGPAGVSVAYRPAVPVDLASRAEALARDADVVVAVVGTNEDWESEGFDRDDMTLPGDQDALISLLARANPNVVVVVNVGSPVEMPWADEVGAILQCWLPGQEAGNSLVDVLFGDVNPSGRLPVTIPVHFADSGAAAGYPSPDGHLVYGEGLDVGYRHFDAKEIVPRFCFGHGLSYTTFSYTELRVTEHDGDEGEHEGEGEGVWGSGIWATVTVTNTGRRAGAEIAQCYVGARSSGQPRPVRELKGVAKLHLAPGESAMARFALARSAFASWDAKAHEFTVEPGRYEIAIGASSRDLRLSEEVGITTAGALAT